MIRVEDITYSYPSESDPAVKKVSLELRPGEIAGVVGPNGSGKSTLGRLIKGLILPSDGTIHVDGLDPFDDGLDIRKRVGLLFQNPNSQIVNAVVEQEVAFGPENLGLPSAEIRERVDEALTAVRLQHLKTAECHRLSMADKQRVALASVIAMNPQYLVLDEPTAWLEPTARWSLLEHVLQWCSEREVGLLLITHRMDEAALCDRLYGMLHGVVEVTGNPSEVLRNDAIRERLALEVPDTLLLAEHFRAAGLPVGLGGGVKGLAEAICPS